MTKKILLIPCKEVSREEKSRIGKIPGEPLFHCLVPGYVSIVAQHSIHISTLNIALHEWGSITKKINHAVENSSDKIALVFGTQEMLAKIFILE